MEFTHFDEQGNARMVDVTEKGETVREAVAKGRIRVSAECFGKIKEGTMAKGDVLGVARIAGIMGAKRTSELIPLCHILNLSKAEVEFICHDETCEIEIQTTLEHLSFLMKNASEIEVQAIINVSALVTKLKEEELISAIEEEAADAQADEKLPGIVGLILTGSSDLWEIAKKYHTTVSAIRKTNELEEETELNGRKILVVKQVLDIG